jgi:hypothetical protein
MICISLSPSSTKDLESSSSVMCKRCLRPSVNAFLIRPIAMPTMRTKRQKKLVKADEAKNSYWQKGENPPVNEMWKTATTAKTCTGVAIESTIQAIFLQYSTILLEETSWPWIKIVEEEIDCSPFSDINGVQHTKKHPRSIVMTDVRNDWIILFDWAEVS